MNKGFDEGIAIKKGVESAVDCMMRNVNARGAASSPHYHDYVELLYGTDCDITVWVNDRTLHFETGDLVIINPHETHALYSNSQKSDYIVIKFMPEILQYSGQMTSEIMYLLPILHSSPRGEHIIKHGELSDDNINDIVFEIYNEWTAENFGYELAIRSGIIKLFLQIVRYWNNNTENKNLFAEADEMTMIIYKAAEYCFENYGDITAKKMADKFSLSYAYFSRSFKKVMGRSFSQYINDVRINHARRLLLTTSASMTKIAAETGFSSASHFIHNFKEKTGVSPLNYKKEFKEKLSEQYKACQEFR